MDVANFVIKSCAIHDEINEALTDSASSGPRRSDSGISDKDSDTTIRHAIIFDNL